MRKFSRDFWRLTMQSLSLTVFTWLVFSQVYPLEWKGPVLLWISRLDPLILLSHLRWQNHLPSWAWLPLVVLIPTLFWGRVFCGWLCPLGGLLAWMDRISLSVFRSGRSGKSRLLTAIDPFRYSWLLFLGLVFTLGSNWVLFLSPLNLFSHEVIRILHLTVPWVIAVILIATLFFSRLWCSLLCPTGLLLSLISQLRSSRYVTGENCTRCGKCLEPCPVGAAPARPGSAREWCLACGTCKDACPAGAVEWKWVGRKSRLEGLGINSFIPRSISRRQFISLTAALLAAALLWRKMAWAAVRVLRPPGALNDPLFGSLCARCGRCVKVCPNQALKTMTLDRGLANFETPEFIPRQGRCDLCMVCQEVCPTGAIARIPLESVKMGSSIIDQNRCLAWTEDKLCLVCGEQCPFQAIDHDARMRPSVVLERCIGCGACENGCPVPGESAIRVFPS